ncbi:MAG: cupin domain-containing protein [Chromatiales bacterium]
MKLQWPDSIDVDIFLSDYWQKKPLLIRQAFPALEKLITPDELAGLACEADIESRLIYENVGAHQWQLEHGPLPEQRFAGLPESHWTLLVQDIDKHLPEFAEWLEHFNFVPEWRIDDIMISYAADQGSVGPHTDSYDVFLLQLEGTRRWQISDRQYRQDDLLENSYLKIIRDFDCSDEWLLQPGDMLYLPPDVGHWGIAEGPCITASVGFNSPSLGDLFDAFTEQLLQKNQAGQRYHDPDIRRPEDICRFDDSTLCNVKDMLQAAIARHDSSDIATWFGCLISRGKPHLGIETAPQPIHVDQLQQRLRSDNALARHPWLKLVYHSTSQQLTLFARGETFNLDIHLKPLVQQLCHQRSYRFDPNWIDDPQALALLTDLYNHGYLIDDED